MKRKLSFNDTFGFAETQYVTPSGDGVHNFYRSGSNILTLVGVLDVISESMDQDIGESITILDSAVVNRELLFTLSDPQSFITLADADIDFRFVLSDPQTLIDSVDLDTDFRFAISEPQSFITSVLERSDFRPALNDAQSFITVADPDVDFIRILSEPQSFLTTAIEKSDFRRTLSETPTFSDTAGVSSFPETWEGYAEATPDNPASTQTDFSFWLDLSILPSEWWDAVQTDGKDIRVSTDANVLLPRDLFLFNYGAQTGFLILKRTKTTSNEVFRIWSGDPNAIAPASNSTYGQFNAYDSNWKGFWPSGGGNDRTVNANHCTSGGGITVGGGESLIGVSTTTYNGSGQFSSFPTSFSTYPFSLLCIAKQSTTTGTQTPMGVCDTAFVNGGSGASAAYSSRLIAADATPRFTVLDTAAATTTQTSSVTHTELDWVQSMWSFTSTTSRAVYVNGAPAGTSTVSRALSSIDTGTIGCVPWYATGSTFGTFERFIGDIGFVQAHDIDRSADFEDYQYAMFNQATFWNTWTWTAP